MKNSDQFINILAFKYKALVNYYRKDTPPYSNTEWKSKLKKAGIKSADMIEALTMFMVFVDNDDLLEIFISYATALEQAEFDKKASINTKKIDLEEDAIVNEMVTLLDKYDQKSAYESLRNFLDQSKDKLGGHFSAETILADAYKLVNTRRINLIRINTMKTQGKEKPCS